MALLTWAKIAFFFRIMDGKLFPGFFRRHKARSKSHQAINLLVWLSWLAWLKKATFEIPLLLLTRAAGSLRIAADFKTVRCESLAQKQLNCFKWYGNWESLFWSKWSVTLDAAFNLSQVKSQRVFSSFRALSWMTHLGQETVFFSLQLVAERRQAQRWPKHT